MSDLIKRLRKALNTFPIIEDSPVDLFQEAADRLDAAEQKLRKFVWGENNPSEYVNALDKAEATIKDISEFTQHKPKCTKGQRTTFYMISPCTCGFDKAILNMSKS